MPADPHKIEKRFKALEADKQPHVGHWKECYSYTSPIRGSGLGADVVSATDAQQQQARIYDSTAPEANKVGVATLMGGMVPSNSQWFDLDLGQENGRGVDAERRFMSNMSRFIWENIHAANFDSEGFDAFLDGMIAGWFVLYCDESDTGGFYFEAWPLGQCYIASTRAAGIVDTVYRKFEMTTAQLVSEYGKDKVSAKVREEFETGKFDNKHPVLLAIEPRSLHAVEPRFGKNMPFASVHMELNSKHVLRESGFHEFPCMCPRWNRIQGSSYATGPMSDALPNVKTLNEVFKWVLMGMEQTQAPMMVATDDGVLNPSAIRMGPRKIIVANSVESIKPLHTGANPDAGAVAIEGMQALIRKILMADHLPPLESATKTATEWNVRVQMLRQMMGPMFGRMQAEFLQPLVERCFGIVWRANIRSGFTLVGEPPQSLLNRSFSIRFLSPLAKAQKLEDVTALDVFEMDLIAKSETNPDLMDIYDWEEAQREKADMRGINQSLIRDKRAVEAIRKQREAAKQEQAQQAMAMQQQLTMNEAAGQRYARAA